VADLRASTPTDAAKRVVPDVAEELSRVAEMRRRGRQVVTARVEREQQALDAVRARPALADPARVLTDRGREVDALRERARRTLHHQLDRAHNDLGHQLARVRGMSPLSTIRRGYAVVQDADGHVVSSTTDLPAGRLLHIRVADGRIDAAVTGVHAADLPDPDDDTAETAETEDDR
jgi:exodeoxyribonuclease VII large subunit